jgi:hypothetical protein
MQFGLEISKVFVDLVGAVAWPTVTLAIVFMFRRQIVEHVGPLLQRLSSLKAGPLEATWGDRARKAGEIAEESDSERLPEPDVVSQGTEGTAPRSESNSDVPDQADLPSGDREANEEPGAAAAPTKNHYTARSELFKDFLLKDLNDADRIIVDSPLGAVLSSFQVLERLLRDIAGAPDERATTARQLIERLSKTGLVNAKNLVGMLELNQLRNEAAHGQGGTLTPRDARDFVDSVRANFESFTDQAFAYELKAAVALAERFGHMTRVSGIGFDFTVPVKDRSVGIIIKYTQLPEIRLNIFNKALSQSQRHAPDFGLSGILCINNSDVLSNEHDIASHLDSPLPVTFLLWRGHEDDRDLRHALLDLASTTEAKQIGHQWS